MDSKAAADASAERSARRWTWLLPLLVLGGLAVLYAVSSSFQSFVEGAYGALASGERARIERWTQGFGAWGVAAVVALMLFQTLVPFLPSLAPMVVAVLVYGPVQGGLLAWGGMLLAAAFGYGIGRGVGPATVDRLLGSAAERKVTRFVRRYGWWSVIAARISPAFSTDAVSIVAGLARMRFLRFLLATGLGTLPLAILVAWLGADVDRLGTGLIVVSVLSLAALTIWVVYDRRRRRRDDGEPGASVAASG